MKIIIPRNNYLRIKVIPKSPANEVTEIMQEDTGLPGQRTGEPTIKIRIKAVPEKGKANAELIKFLSHELNLPKENIEIISGKNSALKLLRIKWTSTTSR